MLVLVVAVLGGTVGVGWNTDAFESARNMVALWFGETNSATVELETDETPGGVAAQSPEPAPTPHSSPLPATSVLALRPRLFFSLHPLPIHHLFPRLLLLHTCATFPKNVTCLG